MTGRRDMAECCVWKRSCYCKALNLCLVFFRGCQFGLFLAWFYCCSGWKVTSSSLTTCQWVTRRPRTLSSLVVRSVSACCIGRPSRGQYPQPRTTSFPPPRNLCLSPEERERRSCEDALIIIIPYLKHTLCHTKYMHTLSKSWVFAPIFLMVFLCNPYKNIYEWLEWRILYY